MTTDDSSWIGYGGDRHGRPASDGNDHLADEQRQELLRRGEDLARERGRHQAVIVIDVYENGEAVPQVQLPKGSSVDLTDSTQVDACVANAVEALRNWR